jgi:hypothetical protein
LTLWGVHSRALRHATKFVGTINRVQFKKQPCKYGHHPRLEADSSPTSDGRVTMSRPIRKFIAFSSPLLLGVPPVVWRCGLVQWKRIWDMRFTERVDRQGRTRREMAPSGRKEPSLVLGQRRGDTEKRPNSVNRAQKNRQVSPPPTFCRTPQRCERPCLRHSCRATWTSVTFRLRTLSS